MEKSGRYQQVNITSKGTNQKSISLEHEYHVCDITAPNTLLEFNKTSDKPILRHNLENNWLVIFKSVKVMKIKKRLKNYSRLKNRDMTITQHVLLILLLQEHIRTIGKT